MMPGENGIEFTKWIKANYERLPVLILTAKGDANDRISGLESGADDYMAKPFEPKELVLRLKNILQRAKIPHEAVDEIYTFGRYSFNIKDLRLKDRDVYIHITQGEAGSLKLLCQSVGKPVTRETMAAYFGDIDPRSIDVVMARLRRKIEIDTKNPIYLHTVRNEGYLLHTDQS
jgi:two-component system phosphate regulon response regulator OmpR